MWGDRYRNVVGIFMNQLLQNKSMSIFGDGTQLRAFTHVNDVAPIIAECVNYAKAKNEVFNLGADIAHSVNDLAAIVAKEMGKPCKIDYLEARNEVKIAFSDHSKASAIFGSKEKVSLKNGIHLMAEWVKKNGARESSIFENIEVAKKMPPSWARVLHMNV